MPQYGAQTTVKFPATLKLPPLKPLRYLLCFLALGFAFILLPACVTAPSSKAKAKQDFVGNVDFSEAPEMKAFAERSRQVASEMYPKIWALIRTGPPEASPKFDIVFKNGSERSATAMAIRPIFTKTLSTTISLRCDDFRDNPAAFEQLLVHEMTHVAQRYIRPVIPKILSVDAKAPFCWVEGIADYTCMKLGLTNGIDCPECGTIYSHYKDGYSCTAAFLLYVEAKYDSNLVHKLDAALRHTRPPETVFIQSTGKKLPELWEEFQKTSAFTSNAAKALELEHSLGYVNGDPPKDVDARFKAFLNQHSNAVPGKVFTYLSENKHKKPQRILEGLYLYFSRPEGTPEGFLLGLLTVSPGLPGFHIKEEDDTLSSIVLPGDLEETKFPFTKTLTCKKKGSSETYHYTVVKNSPEGSWKLDKAWRTAQDGHILETFKIP